MEWKDSHLKPHRMLPLVGLKGVAVERHARDTCILRRSSSRILNAIGL